MTEEFVRIDYSLDEYSSMLRVEGRCTLGGKTVYGIYVFSKGYAKRRNWCGLYIVEDYLKESESESGEERATVFKFPISHMEAVLGPFLRASPGMKITELVFCDKYRCYPTLRGLYPIDRVLERLAVVTDRRDVLVEFHRMFGGVNAIDYIFYRTPARVFYLSVMLPRGRPKYIVFVPTPNPAENAIEVSKLQLLKDKVVRQLILILIGDRPDTIGDTPGLRALGITLEDIERAVRKVYSEDKTRQPHLEDLEDSAESL